MHVTMMLVFLIWLFVRHREQYRPVRQVMAWTTLGCLLVQLMPVAPPRMLPGIQDTGLLYNQSVYSNGLPIDQLSAMPSMHVAWAVLVGYYTWRISPSRWRYVGPVHAAITVFVVLATGNHWWLDGVVAVAILALCAWGVYGVRTAWRHALVRLDSSRPPLEPALAESGARG
jgi:membrane-associated phospholipid phosphatase